MKHKSFVLLWVLF